MDKLTPCLWFDGKAEEAARFYTSIFPNSRIDKINRSPGDDPSGPKDAVITVNFTLAGQLVHRAERRPGLQVQRGHLDLDRLRRPGRGRPLLGCAARRRRRGERLRLAEGPLRRFVAGHPAAADGALQGLGPRGRRPRLRGHAEDGQDRRRRDRARRSRRAGRDGCLGWALAQQPSGMRPSARAMPSALHSARTDGRSAVKL